jgi:hypothetical protein
MKEKNFFISLRWVSFQYLFGEGRKNSKTSVIIVSLQAQIWTQDLMNVTHGFLSLDRKVWYSYKTILQFPKKNFGLSVAYRNRNKKSKLTLQVNILKNWSELKQ